VIVLLAPVSIALLITVAMFSRAHKSLDLTLSMSVASFLVVFLEWNPVWSAFQKVGMLVALGIALARSRLPLKTLGWPVTTFLVLTPLVAVITSTDVDSVLAQSVELVTAMALVIAVASSTSARRLFLTRFLPIVVVFQVSWGVFEVFFGGTSIWPRMDGETMRLEAVNHLITEVRARAMGSSGYSIPYGIVMAFSALCFVHMWSVTRKAVWPLLTLCALAGIFLGGSRTALLAFFIGLMTYVVFR
jgi:hypothetical protein